MSIFPKAIRVDSFLHETRRVISREETQTKVGNLHQTAPDDPHTLYAALSPAAMSQAGSIYRSQDLGETWQRFDRRVTPRRTMMSVAVSPRNPTCVYGVNSIGQAFGTQDGGETWWEFPLPVGLRNVYTIACA